MYKIFILNTNSKGNEMEFANKKPPTTINDEIWQYIHRCNKKTIKKQPT